MKRVVPGIHSVQELLKVRPKTVQELWLRDGPLHDEFEDFFQTAQRHHIKVKRAPMRAMDRQVQSHQGVIAYTNGAPEWPSNAELKSLESGLIFVLDGLEDPHNVGSLMRSAWNLGALGLITTKDRAAGGAPSAQKVASGAFEHIPLLEVANLHAELKLLKDLGFWIYGLSEKADQLISKTDLAKKSVLVIGAEGSGLRKPTLSACDALVRIPQSESANSFNASVAGALAGYEFLRQRNLF